MWHRGILWSHVFLQIQINSFQFRVFPRRKKYCFSIEYFHLEIKTCEYIKRQFKTVSSHFIAKMVEGSRLASLLPLAGCCIIGVIGLAIATVIICSLIPLYLNYRAVSRSSNSVKRSSYNKIKIFVFFNFIYIFYFSLFVK